MARLVETGRCLGDRPAGETTPEPKCNRGSINVPEIKGEPVAEPARMRSGEYARWAILNSDLRLSHVPDRASGREVRDGFALSFDGYAYRGPKELGPWANRVSRRFQRDSNLLDQTSLSDLRALLFYEQRRAHHFGEGPDPMSPWAVYVDSLFDAIRARLT